MLSVITFTATIYVGFREQYTNTIHTIEEAYAVCQEYTNEIGLCVTVTPTMFVYTEGNEPGCAIGLIDYPRFPATSEEIKEKANTLAKRFMEEFNQLRVSVVYLDETVTFLQEEL